MTLTLTAPVTPRDAVLTRAEDGRNYVSGIVVPFDEPFTTETGSEVFRRGAFADWLEDPDTTLDTVPLRWMHSRGELLPIGVAVRAEERDAGLWVEFRLATTQDARDVFILVEDRTLRYFSIEFINRSPNRPPPSPDKSKPQGVVTRAFLIGTAIVEHPAFRDATVTAVRDKTHKESQTMTDVIERNSPDTLADDMARMGDHEDRMGDEEERMPDYVRDLVRQLSGLEERIARMEGGAKEENRSLTEAEQAVHAELSDQIATAQNRMEAWHQTTQRQQRTKKLMAAVVATAAADEAVGIDHQVRGDGQGERSNKVTRVKHPDVYHPDNRAQDISFFRDLYRYSNMADVTVRTQPGFTDSINRINAHHEKALEEMPQERAVLTSNLAGIVPPQYLLELTAPGLYDGRMTANLMARYPLPALGEEFNIPRFTTRASAGVQTTQNTAVTESSPAVTNTKFNLSTIASYSEISRQSLDRGFMVDSLISNEMMSAYNLDLNEEILYGPNDGTDNLTNQRGILLENSLGTRVAYTEGSPTLIKLWQTIGLQLGALSARRKMRANAIIMSPELWAKFTSSVDGDNRPLFQNLVQTATNVAGLGDPQMAIPGPIAAVGEMHAVPVFTDDQITNTFNNNDKAQTGGAETRIVLARREDMLIMESGQGPMTASYDATAATKLMNTLVVYGYVASTIGRYPEGTAIIRGTGSNPNL